MEDRLQSQECARLLKALADADRLRVIQCLQEGPMNVSQIAQALGADIAKISHHLGVLRHAHLVVDQKDGKYVIYTLSPDVFRAGRHGQVVELGCCRLELGGD